MAILLMLTSDLGVQRTGPAGERIANVTPDDPRETVEARVTSAVEHTLRFELSRPELLNRIGENIIVFDFIRKDAAEAIFEKMVEQILERVASEHGIRFTLADAARVALRERCLADLGHGGRGIGNQLEAALVNPLAEALATLVDGLRTWEREREAALDIMVYSGLPQRHLARDARRETRELRGGRRKLVGAPGVHRAREPA